MEDVIELYVYISLKHLILMPDMQEAKYFELFVQILTPLIWSS